MKTRVINFIKRFAAVALFAPAVAMAAGASVHLDKAPVSTEPAALQHGAIIGQRHCARGTGVAARRDDIEGRELIHLLAGIIALRGQVGDGGVAVPTDR